MNKHERAVQLIENQIDVTRRFPRRSAEGLRKDDAIEDAFTYALKVLEAVEGVEPWMVTWLKDPDTDEAWAVVPKELWADDDHRWTRVDHHIAARLQALLDAKGEGP